MMKGFFGFGIRRVKLRVQIHFASSRKNEEKNLDRKDFEKI